MINEQLAHGGVDLPSGSQFDENVMIMFPRGEQPGEPVSLHEFSTGVLALSSSSFLQQIWREGWKRAGLEMGG